MKNSFILSFKLRIAYRVNTIIYAIKQIPLIKKLIPDAVYGASGLKEFGYIIAFLYEIIQMFLGKFIYMFLFVYLVLNTINLYEINDFFNIMFFMSIIGSYLNTFMFEPSNDKYYALIVMKMDSKKYTISNYFYNIFKSIFGFIPPIIIFSLILKLNPIISLIIPIFIGSIKINTGAFYLKRYEKDKFIPDIKHKDILKWLIIIPSFILAYLLPLLHISLSIKIYIGFMIISILLLIKSIKCIYNFNDYYAIYKVILNDDNMNTIDINGTEINKSVALSMLDDKHKFTSKKNGYAYFNELFIKRHNKVLYRFIKKVTIIIFCLFLVILGTTIFIDEMKFLINKKILTIIPAFLFIMYYINTGLRVAKIFFMNCDSAMLTFSFYKEREVILNLFKERLKSIIKMNLIPSMTLSFCIIILLIVSKNYSLNDYILVFLSINAMSIFFSVHNIVIYYLLQPFNASSDIKGGTFQIINMMTYFACYYICQMQIDIHIFATSILIFSILYIIISLYLVNKYASKTFKIRA